MTIPRPSTAPWSPSRPRSGDVVGPALRRWSRSPTSASLLVETDVPEGRLHLVKKGGPCEIVLDAYPDKRFRGEVVEVSPRLNRAKATAP